MIGGKSGRSQAADGRAARSNGVYDRNRGPVDVSATVSPAAAPTVVVMLTSSLLAHTRSTGVSGSTPALRSRRAPSSKGMGLMAAIP
jgi:hypothetical protein